MSGSEKKKSSRRKSGLGRLLGLAVVVLLVLVIWVTQGKSWDSWRRWIADIEDVRDPEKDKHSEWAKPGKAQK